MALPAVNYTHANENWRQRLVKEKAAAQVPLRRVSLAGPGCTARTVALQACCSDSTDSIPQLEVRQPRTPRWICAQDFIGTYDYLVWKHTPTHLNRPNASCKVKYYKPLGGDWTVKDKRIGLREQHHAEELSVRLHGRTN